MTNKPRRFVLDEQFTTWEAIPITTGEPQPADELEVPPCTAWGAWLMAERLRQQWKRDDAA